MGVAIFYRTSTLYRYKLKATEFVATSLTVYTLKSTL